MVHWSWILHTNNYSFFCIITLLLLTMYLALVNASISWNTTFTTIVAKSVQVLWIYFYNHVTSRGCSAWYLRYKGGPLGVPAFSCTSLQPPGASLFSIWGTGVVGGTWGLPVSVCIFWQPPGATLFGIWGNGTDTDNGMEGEGGCVNCLNCSKSIGCSLVSVWIWDFTSYNRAK